MRTFALTAKAALLAMALAPGILMAGCKSTPPALPPETAFDPKAAAYIHAKGEGSIDGQAFLVLPNGRTRLAAGEMIRLVPATPYARERFTALYKGRKYLPASDIPTAPVDPSYGSFSRTTTATSAGHFRFEDVAPGDYFITAQKIYRTPGHWLPEGGAMYESVSVKGDETVKVVIVGR